MAKKGGGSATQAQSFAVQGTRLSSADYQKQVQDYNAAFSAPGRVRENPGDGGGASASYGGGAIDASSIPGFSSDDSVADTSKGSTVNTATAIAAGLIGAMALGVSSGYSVYKMAAYAMSKANPTADDKEAAVAASLGFSASRIKQARIAGTLSSLIGDDDSISSGFGDMGLGGGFGDSLGGYGGFGALGNAAEGAFGGGFGSTGGLAGAAEGAFGDIGGMFGGYGDSDSGGDGGGDDGGGYGGGNDANGDSDGGPGQGIGM